MSKSGKIKTIRYIELVQQLEYMPYSVDELETRLKSYENLKEYSLIVHDRDVVKDGEHKGELKAPHIHCVIGFKTPSTLQTISNYLDIDKTRFNFIADTPKSAKLYLVHAKDDYKEKYDPSEVKSTFDYVQWYQRQVRTGALNQTSLKEQAEDVLEKLATGEYKEYDLYDEDKVSGLLYVRNKKKFLDMIEWTYKTKQKKEKKMKVLFVTGVPGIGKSRYAVDYAKTQKMHYYISSGGKNALDDYHGEECIILDDWRDFNMSVADMCKLLDNYINSMVGCRYYNKSIVNCELLIITSCVDIQDFYDGLSQKGEIEPIQQICRRINLRVEITHQYYIYSSYDQEKDVWVILGRTPTPEYTAEVLQAEVEKEALNLASVMGKVETVPTQQAMFNPRKAKETTKPYKGAYKTDEDFKRKIDKVLETTSDDEDLPF